MVFDPEVAQTPDGQAVPQGVHLGTHATNRAYMLDWESRPNTITPEAADGTTRQSPLDDVFGAHRDAQLVGAFGEGATMEHVLQAIEITEALGDARAAQALRAKLGQVNQHAVVETLNVQDSTRYAPGGDTYCNIYASDYAAALGAYVPRTWWYENTVRQIRNGARVVTVEQYAEMQRTGQSVRNVIRPVYGQTIREMNANSLNAWFDEWGGYFGWTEVATAADAQEQANQGRVVVISAANRDASAAGHINVVLAETDDRRAARDAQGNIIAPLTSQAGRNNYNYSNPAQNSGRSQWWQNASHTNGGFYVWSGTTRSPIATPEQLGASR
jgi:hypothetical protein